MLGIRRLYPPEDQLITFLRGANSLNPRHEIPLHAHQVMENVVLDEQGAVTKRWGFTANNVAANDGNMLAELVRNDGTSNKLAIYGLSANPYSLVNLTTPAGIRVYVALPFKLTVTDTGTGAVGANLATATLYQYAVCAVMSAKRTPYNLLTDAATTGEITTGATAYPIKIDCYGCYGATTYEVWRRTYSGSWGGWGRLTAAVTHSTANGATTLTYTDSGNVVPDTAALANDVTSYRSTSAVHTFSGGLFDWISVRKSGNNVLLFTNGAGLFWTDGTDGYAVQPAVETLGGVPLTENRLWDVTDEVWTAKGLHNHHRYVFAGDMTSFPQTFVYSDVDDFSYFPQNGFVTVPDPLGGRILDFATKDETLVIGLTTGMYALWGREFPTNGPDPTINYFTKVSDVGVASEWSMAIAPNGWLVYHGADKQPHFLTQITAGLVNSTETRLCEQIYPTIQAYSDHDDAYACVDGNTYYLVFPSDARILKVRFYNTPTGPVFAPTIDTFVSSYKANQLTRFSDGKLYALRMTNFGHWQMYKPDVYTDGASDAVTMKVTTAAYGCGADAYGKHFRRVHTVYKPGSTAYTVTTVPYVDNQTLSSVSLSSPADSSYKTPKLSELDCTGKGRYIVFEFTNASSTVRPTLYGFQIEYTTKRIPRGDA